MKITKRTSNNHVKFVTHKRFAALFFRPSCCVNSLFIIIMWQLSLLTFPVKLVILLLLDLLQSRSLITNCLPILGNYICKKWLRGVFNISKSSFCLWFFFTLLLLSFDREKGNNYSVWTVFKAKVKQIIVA